MAFPVTCPACGKAFQLATEIYERKVAGKVVSIKCKQCQSGIRVDATQPGELKVIGATPAGGGDLSVGPKPPEVAKPKEAAPPNGDRPQPAPVRMRQPTLIGMVNPTALAQKPAAAPAAPAPRPATPALWAVDSGGTGDDRELNDEEIRREIQAGNLTAQTLAWREGMAEWLEIEKIPELSRHLKLARKEPSAPRAAERPPVREFAKEASFQEEPDAEATMVYDRSAPNAALEPFAAPEQPAFTKTAPLAAAPQAFAKTTPLEGAPPPPPLPAAGRPPAPAPALPKSAPAAAPPPPLPKSAPAAAPAAFAAAPAPAAPPPPAPVAAAPAPAPAFPKPAARAPVLAEVPWGDPLPSAKPAVPGLPTAPYGPDPFAIAATTDLDFPNPRSKKPLVIAVVVGIVVVIGIGIAIVSSSSPPVANIAAPPPVPTNSPEPRKAEPTPTNEPVRDDSQGTSAPATQPQQPQQPNGNFSDLFSKGAEKAKGSGSGSARGFDEAQAREALSGLLGGAAACKEPGGQMGQTTATITFEPSGNVSGVTVGAPFAGTSTGTCIITAFKKAKVAPFTGLPGTVSQTISLR